MLVTHTQPFLVHQIIKSQIMRDPHTRDSRGFGFVTFENPEDADAAMAALNATTLDDRTITVEKVGLQTRLLGQSPRDILANAESNFDGPQARRGRARTRRSSSLPLYGQV